MQEIYYEQVQYSEPGAGDLAMIVCYDIAGKQSGTRPHWHGAVEIALVLENPLVVIEGGVSREVEEGDVSLINSDVVHTTRGRYSDQQSKGLVILLSVEMLKTACPDFEQYLFVIPPSGSIREQIIGILKEIYDCKQHPRPYDQALINSLLWKLVWELMDSCLVEKKGSQMSAQKDDYLARQALSYIEQHFKEELSLSQLASYVGLQENYFCRYFRKYVGMSFGQYLAQVRLRYGLAYMVEFGASVVDSALEAGFPSARSMTDWCRKIYGVTPAQFKRGQPMLPFMMQYEK